MKTTTSYYLIPLLISLAVFTAACGSTLVEVVAPTATTETVAIATPSPTLTPEPTATSTATDTPTPEPTATPTSAPTNTPTPRPTATPTPKPRLPFEGLFEGTVAGDDRSSAPLSLDLTQNGTAVSGTATLGEGLRVDVGAGLCPGVQPVPAASLDISSQTSPNNPRRIESNSTIVVSGYNVGVTVVADVSADGNDLTALITLITPFPCRNPQLPVSLTRSD